jgi:LytR cell envelope-related transcriptional attenuator
VTDPAAPGEPEPPGEPGAARRRPPVGAAFTRSILGAFARGTGLIAVALVIGVVLLQWSDASTDAAAGGRPPVAGTPAAPAATSSSTTGTTAPAGPRAPADLTVLVLNATGRNNQAKPMSDRLAVVGYRTLTPGTAARRPDSVVLCRPGLGREASALVAATGLPAATQTIDAGAAAGLPGATQADCVVVIGSR